MLSTTEQEYIKSIIDTYSQHGYKYYVLVSRRTNYYTDDFEYFLYLSTKNVSSSYSNTFVVSDGILVKIDTSTKGNNNSDNNLVVERFDGVLSVDVAEFVYTNAKVDYDFTTEALNPDVMLGGDVNYETNTYTNSIMFILVCAVLISYLFKLFR